MNSRSGRTFLAHSLARNCGRLEQKASVTDAKAYNLIEPWPTKTIKLVFQIIIRDLNHDVHVVLTALRQHRLRSFPVIEDSEAFQLPVDHVQRHRPARVE